MNLIKETEQIATNAKDAYKRGEITAKQFKDATQIPLKDMLLTIHDTGGVYLLPANKIYQPFEEV